MMTPSDSDNRWYFELMEKGQMQQYGSNVEVGSVAANGESGAAADRRTWMANGIIFYTAGKACTYSVDNLKVSQTNSESKAVVTSIKTIDSAGNKTDITNTVKSDSDRNVEFSAPLNNTKGIVLYYPQDEDGAAPEYTVDMSSDNKSATIKLTKYDMNKNITLSTAKNMMRSTTLRLLQKAITQVNPKRY